jgi:hypothetical protein
MKKIKHFYILLVAGILVTAALTGFYGLSLWAASNLECEKLDESRCLNRVECVPIYSPGFQKCITLPSDLQTKLARNKNLCRQTGGEWRKTKYGHYCYCATVYPPMIYQPGRGCVEK